MPYKDKAKNATAKKESAARAKARDPVAYRKRDVEKSLLWQKRNPERVKAANKWYKLKNPGNILVWQAKDRARRQGIACDLKIGDITIPTHCPVLGIRLARGCKKWADSSPSLDRFDPKLGYTKSNVRVISWRANNLKRDGTIEEFERIVAYMRGEL